LPEYWAKSVQFGDANGYLQTRKIDSAVLFYFIADSWNDLKLKWHSKAVKIAFKSAKTRNKYPSNRKITENARSYFNILSQTYFWQTQSYPRNRGQLMKVDRIGALAVEKAWEVTTPPLKNHETQLVQTSPCNDPKRYSFQNIKGWNICFNKNLPSKTKSRIITKFNSDFNYIQDVLKRENYNFLKKNVPIFVEEKGHGGLYHLS